MNDTTPLIHKHFTLPTSNTVTGLVNSLSMTGKAIFFFLVVVFVGSGMYLAFRVNAAFLVNTPISGGTLTEGVIGLPRFINPVLAVTNASQDLTRLVYSGLMKQLPDGSLAPDLAGSYTVSDDGRTYTFTLRDDIYFHDNKPVTSDDVEYTIERAIDSTLKSPEQAAWQM